MVKFQPMDGPASWLAYDDVIRANDNILKVTWVTFAGGYTPGHPDTPIMHVEAYNIVTGADHILTYHPLDQVTYMIRVEDNPYESAWSDDDLEGWPDE